MAGGSRPSTLDLLLFHRQEREFFHRLVHQLGQKPVTTRWVMALWLWFESIGHHDFIRHVSSSNDRIVEAFLAEADSCLGRLLGTRTHAEDEQEELPLTNTLVAEPIGLRFFDYHRDVALKGVTYFVKNVAEIIFDDGIMEKAAQDPNHPATRRVLSSGLHIWQPNVEQSAWSMPSTSQSPPRPTSRPPSVLNPMARPWSPVTEQSSDDQRSMFITFSRGYPLTREDIKDFFNTRFGPCVEMVMIERAPAGAAPMYGRVVFTNASMIAPVLNGQRTAKFMINGRHLWARMYVPRTSAN
ncbi:hypothetical protein HPP92_025614 [Vanilla planifolia]|uniref:RRM domain-containing protein n=1 Tax=Vanilla planifolia TaxID=51239 RepID=A0A835U9I6_VANPL|nr:hypothetical protein HPP92_025614 [Vanilla planifolia]